MGFEKPNNSPGSGAFDDILNKLEQTTPKPHGEMVIDGVQCKVFETSFNTWNVYLEGLPYSVTKRQDGSYVADDQSPTARPQAAAVSEKELAIKAVEVFVTDALQ